MSMSVSTFMAELAKYAHVWKCINGKLYFKKSDQILIAKFGKKSNQYTTHGILILSLLYINKTSLNFIIKYVSTKH